MTTSDIVSAIITDPSIDTDALYAALKERVTINRAIASATVRSTLRIGSRVTLKGLRPAYVNGMTGTVNSIRRSKVGVTLTENDYATMRLHRTYASRIITVPMSCVEVI